MGFQSRRQGLGRGSLSVLRQWSLSSFPTAATVPYKVKCKCPGLAFKAFPGTG